MANDKYKQPTRVTPKRPQAAAYGAEMPKISAKEFFKKHRSTVIIFGIILTLIIVYAVSSSLAKVGKYDIYALNSELNTAEVNVEYREFIQIIADSGERIGGYVNNGVTDEEKEGALADIAACYDEILYFDIPEKLIRTKAAALDMVSLHYKYVNGKQSISSETLNESLTKLSAELDRAVK